MPILPRLYLRSRGEVLALFDRIEGIATKRGDIDFFERALIERGLVPKSYLLKHGELREIDKFISELIDAGRIQKVSQNDVEIFIPIPPEIKPFRAGRYTRAEHPKTWRPRGTRPNIPMPMSPKDRNLLWYLGDGRLGEGLQELTAWFRKTVKRESFPNVPEDVL
jgi:hypothetical protein